MQSDVSLQRIKSFPPMMWILLFGAFITRGSYYMVWPFLSVILIKKFGISATEVGLILTGAAVTAVFTGFIGGALSDLFGRKTIMYASGIIYIVSFSLLANVNSIVGYAVVITFCSIATEIWRPSTSALVGDIIKDKQTRELAMQGLYFAVNVGSAIGPMLGFWMGLVAEPESFYITAAAFAVLLVLISWGFTTIEQKTKPDERQAPGDDVVEQKNERQASGNRFAKTLSVLAKDRLLQVLIVANIFCMFIYGQMDSTLIQYLTRESVPNLLALVSSMIFTNATVIVLSQFLLLRLMAKMSLVTRIQLGLSLLLMSQVWMALNPVAFFWGWIMAVVVMSLAETILFPTMNVHIDRIAPDHLRGAYFGATAFYSFGFALAPLGGGLILDHLGGPGVYWICGILSVVVIWLYSILERLPRPESFESEGTEIGP